MKLILQMVASINKDALLEFFIDYRVVTFALNGVTCSLLVVEK